MSDQLRYPELYSFLSAEFADADLEGKSDIEVVRQCVNPELVAWHRAIIAEGRQALNAPVFPWQEVADYANRHLETETAAKQWLANMLSELEHCVERTAEQNQ